MSILAVIPARGGSKRIPNKNIRHFLGKPIIHYPVEAALQSNLFDEIMVSTDDEKISSIAKSAGAGIPFFRSKKNADDYATLSDVLIEVLNQYASSGIHIQYVCCILPTAVFVTSKRLKESFEIIKEQALDSVFPVLRFSYPIQRGLKFNGNKIEMLWPENLNTRSQDLTPTYHDCGQFYWINTERFLQTGKIFSENCSAIIIEEYEAHDIDTEEDWKMAELKYEFLQNFSK